MSGGLKMGFTLMWLAIPAFADGLRTIGTRGPASTRFDQEEFLDLRGEEHPVELECPPDAEQKSLPGRGTQWTWCELPDGTKEGPHLELRNEIDWSSRDRRLRQIRIETMFLGGVPEGEFAVRDEESGELLVEGRYEEGEPAGEWLRHDLRSGAVSVIPPGTY